MDASTRDECFPGTRRDILAFITDWLTTPSKENILWLHGLAGSGKSTLSTTIARYFSGLGRLGAFLFFIRPMSDPSSVVRTIAYQLASFDPHIGEAIAKTIEDFPRIAESSLPDQLQKLVIEPLSSASHNSLQFQGPVVLVLDALDECGDSRSRTKLLSALAEGLCKIPTAYRIFITSRTERDIKSALGGLPNVLAKELEITTQSTSEDILSYLHHRVIKVQVDNSLGPNWSGINRIRGLARRSAGLFIWASTAASFIEDAHDPNESLNKLLEPELRVEAEAALDALYTTALSAAGNWKDKAFVEDFHAILGIILVAREPFSDSAIDHLLGADKRQPSMRTLSRLGCVLRYNPGQSIQVLHPSFADYLSDRKRCGDVPWFIDPMLSQWKISAHCLIHFTNKNASDVCYSSRFCDHHVQTTLDWFESINLGKSEVAGQPSYGINPNVYPVASLQHCDPFRFLKRPPNFDMDALAHSVHTIAVATLTPHLTQEV